MHSHIFVIIVIIIITEVHHHIRDDGVVMVLLVCVVTWFALVMKFFDPWPPKIHYNVFGPHQHVYTR